MFGLDDAVIGISEPMEYNYLKFLRFTLRIVSGWPGKELGEKSLRIEGRAHAYYNTTLSIMYFISGLAFIKKHRKELTFLELGHNYITLLLTILSTSRGFTLCLGQKYRAVAKQFIREIHLFFHKDKTEISMDIHVKVHRFSHFFTIYLTGIQCLTLLMFNVTPVVNNYRSGKYANTHENLVNTTYEHAVYLVYPFNSDTNYNGYIVASIINWYGSYLCITSVCMFDLFLSLMIFNLWGHFKILMNMMETFPKPAAETANIENDDDESKIIHGSVMYSESEQRIVTGKLKDCIEYHRIIVDFTNKMSDAFGMALFAYLAFHQVSGCLLLLECFQSNRQAVLRYLPLTILMFGQLIQLAIIFETIGTMSGKLKDVVYCLPWERMNTQNRKIVYFFFLNVQEPIHVSAGGLVTVGVTTMASIFKTTFSYFAFLRTVSE